MTIDRWNEDDEGRECPECLERERAMKKWKRPVWDTEPIICSTCGYVYDHNANYRDEEVNE